jgi:DNA replication protein
MSYQINPLILKNIKNLNLSLNEFLLIIYFINEGSTLDLERIKSVYNFTEEEVLNIYSSLIEKHIIELVVEKQNGKVTEKISLEMFYDKLILNNKEESKKCDDIYAKFENEFGRSLSPIEYETINKWIENGVSNEIIESALKEAVLNGVTKLRYIDTIIYEWTKKTKKPKEEEYQELFDYDWLGVEND